MRWMIFSLVLMAPFLSWNQTAMVTGHVTSSGVAVLDANIQIIETSKRATVDENGFFSIEVPADQNITFLVQAQGFHNFKKKLKLKAGTKKYIRCVMVSELPEVEVYGKQEIPLYRLDPLKPGTVTVLGNFEDRIKTELGVSSNNELSSGYNVRGGNFDENLIYVNDVEIYRPFLARSGQQEGLSFVNPNMVENILFSAGGFESRYGDKLSSVLDITYKKPTTFGGSATVSILGGDVQFGGVSKDNLLTYNAGVRYRANGYLFNALPTKGEYRPVFADLQTRITYDRGNVEHSLMGYLSLNRYRVVPETRETEFGTVNEALRLRVFFEGQEVSQFNTYLGAYRALWTPTPKSDLRFIASVFRTVESENFDILGQYFLEELERDISSSEFGETAFSRGVGAFRDHARNELDATVYSFAHKGRQRIRKMELLWGVNFKHEHINDKLSEWHLLDSAGYSIPSVSDSVGYTDPNAQPYRYLELSEVVKARNQVTSNRLMGYLQANWVLTNKDSIKWSGKKRQGDSIVQQDTVIESTSFFKINAGVRSHFWDFNNQNVISPRVVLSYKPRWYHYKDSLFLRRNVSFRLSGGLYAQPPFYREYRDFNGDITSSIKAQQSIHIVAGGDYIFYLWGRPFKYTAEVYYKNMRDIIPYEIDNVRIRYFAENSAKAYAYGIDMKLNGQFIKGVESWITLGYLKTEEDLLNDLRTVNYNAAGKEIIPGFTNDDVVVSTEEIAPGYIPRPTDQRVSVGLFFQDRMPSQWNTPKIRWETFSVNLNLVFGTGLPYGPPGRDRWRDILRSPPYRRVDIGFAKDILSPGKIERSAEKSIWKKMNELKVSLEVFNLLDINNTISYTWVEDVTGRTYSVPSYLTSRRINLKLTAIF